ncbi:MAG: extracellular solute-binding protein [Oscillospiraceae bacterium]
MKKLISIILAIAMMCPLMTACGNANQTPKENESITTYTTEGKVTKLVPDPNATGELMIASTNNYDANNENNYFATAKKMYQELYPNVKVTYEFPNYDADEAYINFMTQLNTKIMAGKGPDVFEIPQEIFDPYKIMESGALADMTSYFKNDKNFNVDDFNKNVFYGGQLMGKQYVVPVAYEIPLVLTTKNIVKETGFDVSKCTDYFTCGNEIARVTNENKLKCNQKEMFNNLHIPYSWQLHSGINWINHQEDTVSVDTPEVKEMYEMFKLDILPLLNPSDGSFPLGASFEANSFVEKKIMFADMSCISLKEMSMHMKSLIAKGEEPVIFPWRNVEGKVEAYSFDSYAVRGNSENKQNAYNFIKLLMSAEFFTRFYKSENPFITGKFHINNVATKDYFKSISNAELVGYGANDIRDLPPLPELYIDQIMGYASEVSGMTLDVKGTYILNDIMKSYYKGTKSYEECIENAQDKLEIYISE